MITIWHIGASRHLRAIANEAASNGNQPINQAIVSVVFAVMSLEAAFNDLESSTLVGSWRDSFSTQASLQIRGTATFTPTETSVA